MWNLKLDRLYWVEWLDHTADSHWKDKEETHKGKPAVCTTIGWLKGIDNESIKLHNTYTEEVSGGESLILQNCITKAWEIDFD